jgi:uroporphyrinogen-III synthase
MSTTPTVLLTGPVDRLPEWADAVRAIDWEPFEWPLVQIVPRTVDLVEVIDGLPGHIAITSHHALDALDHATRNLPELLTVPLGVVGARTAEAAERVGFKITPDPAENAKELARAIIVESAPGTQVLWPRGSLAHEFGVLLEDAGLEVTNPVVYDTEPVAHEGAPPPVDVVFFASPSAVRAFAAGENWASTARPVAIGATTLAALIEHGADSASALPEPTPEALVERLREFQSTH